MRVERSGLLTSQRDRTKSFQQVVNVVNYRQDVHFNESFRQDRQGKWTGCTVLTKTESIKRQCQFEKEGIP